MAFNDQDGTILMNDGPWGGKGKSPWGDKPRGSGPQNQNDAGGPPDLDALLRDAQEKFRRSFGGRNAGAPKMGAGLILLILFAVWCATGLYRVQPSEHAVILTFGKWTGTKTQAGLGYHLPWPIQGVQKVDVALDRRVVIGFRDAGSARDQQRAATPGDISSEGLMLTGDENIINIHFVVLWNIADAGKYLFQIRDPETTIKKVAESAMREIIGRTQIQKALTESRGAIETQTRALMQSILDDYSAGISVNNVQLQKVDPPAQVVDAFDDVQRARTDRERLKNEAETYMNDIVPRARGAAQKLFQDFEAYKQATISRAEGDAQRFISVHDAYKNAKDVTEKRMYIETMQEILLREKIIVDDDKGGAGVMPYLPLDQLKPGKKE